MAFIEGNNTIFLEGESPSLRIEKKSRFTLSKYIEYISCNTRIQQNNFKEFLFFDSAKLYQNLAEVYLQFIALGQSSKL